MSFVPFRESRFARRADGSTQPILVGFGIPFRINLGPGSELACSVYFGPEGEIGPLLGDTPDNVYAQAFRVLRQSLEHYGADFVDDADRPVAISAPGGEVRQGGPPRIEP